jgi:hypothetical protein
MRMTTWSLGRLLPSRPNYTYVATDVEGAVLSAVNEISRLGTGFNSIGVTGIVIDTVNRISPLGGNSIGVSRVADVATPLEPHRLHDLWESTSAMAVQAALGAPEGLSGFSLRLGLANSGTESGSKSQVIIETLVRERTLAIQLSSTAVTGKQIVDYRVLGSDGGPQPGWLDRVGTNFLIGQRPADVDRIGLRVIVVYVDGSSEVKDVQIETMSGEIKTFELGKRADVRLPFMDQLAAGTRFSERSLDDLARVLEPQ